MPTVLVIDDEAAIRHAFSRAFPAPLFKVVLAATAREGMEAAKREKPDVIVLDIHLPDSGGLDTFSSFHSLDARTPIILITGHGTTDLAIEAIKRGAYEYLLKPVELGPLRDLVNRACTSSRLMHAPPVVTEEMPDDATTDALVGRCPAMQEVYKAIGRVAPTDAGVLVLGESGTGKELVARAIYHHGKRADRPFLVINCAAIPETLLESELFGHERGAFTGAERKRIGKFEQCAGGTLFLDEVGDMTPLTQSKVLRVLQEQRFERVGGHETIQTDVRIIAATNVDLEQRVAAGAFRADLFFRLNVFMIRLPVLRERGEDLELLTRYYLRRFCRELGKELPTVPSETASALARYPWPGNIRELQSVLKRTLLQLRGSVLLPEFLPAEVREPSPLPTRAAVNWPEFIDHRIAAGSEHVYAESLETMERELLTRVLKHTNGNQLQAAKILGITRGSLRTKLRALGIFVGRTVWSEDDQAD
ncbi:MAG: sigma-54-dependent transcriptional regulator [Gemmataceae bacterium]